MLPSLFLNFLVFQRVSNKNGRRIARGGWGPCFLRGKGGEDVELAGDLVMLGGRKLGVLDAEEAARLGSDKAESLGGDAGVVGAVSAKVCATAEGRSP